MSNNFSAVLTAGRDAEVRYLPSGQAVLTVTGASNTGFGDKQKTLWIRVNLWRKGAENLQPYLTKGTKFYVSGELYMNEYQGNDGTTKQTLELNAQALDLVGGKKEGEAKPAQTTQNKHDNYGDDYDDDISF